MRFCPVIFIVRWFASAAFIALAMSVSAQQTIQFTKPADQDLTSKANALAPAPPRRISAGAFNAPSPLFGAKTATANFDVSQAYYNQNAAAANSAQLQKFAESRRNWMLETPEEILNISTPEKILGLTDPQDAKLSPEERFLQRQDRLEAAGASNNLRRAEASLWRDDPAAPGDASSRFAQTLGGSIPDPARNPNAIFENLNPNAPGNLNQKSVSSWTSPFDRPEPLPKQTPDQLAGMDRFRAMMEPQIQEKAPEPARFSYPPAAAPNPNLQTLPAFNPAGRSFATLENSVGKPTGITPLPGVTGPHQTPAKKDTSLVQPPPWLSTSPQSLPQRQF